MMNPAPEITHPSATHLYRTLWQFAAGDRRRVAAFTTMLVSAQLLKLAIPYLTGSAVQAMQDAGEPAIGKAAWDIALIFAVCAASWAIHGPARVIERFVAINIRERFADALYAKTANLPLDWHETHHSGDTIERVQKSGNALFSFAQNQFIYLQNAVSLIGPIAAIFVLSVPTGAAALAGYLLIAAVLVRFDREMLKLNREHNRAHARYAARLADCLGNIATVLTLRLQEPTRRLLGERLRASFAPLRSSIVLNEGKWCAIDLLNNGIRCGLVVLYGWLALRHGDGLLLGSAVMVYQYAQQAGGVVGNMAGNYQDFVNYQVDLAGVDDIGAARAIIPSTAPPVLWREIRADHIRLSYGGQHGEEAALRDVSLVLRRGARIALVGESGSGKTSLLRVLAGLYTADRARFIVDGRIHSDLAHLGAIATLASQDAEIFEDTIGHNLTLGLAYAPSEIRRACDLAAFTPVLDMLPAGLDTDIAERGLNLSGGQKQRLALARALLAARTSSLLLLDEPTSNLDALTEAFVYENLLGAMPDACIISAIHRLHLLERFDSIILMAEGRVIASGTLETLLERQPLFQALWRRQSASSEVQRSDYAARLSVATITAALAR